MLEKLKDNLRHYFSTGPKVILLFMLLIMGVTIGVTSMRKTVIISVDGKEKKIISYKNTLNEVLKDNNITVCSKDKVMPGLNSKIVNGQKINIKKAVNVDVIYAGKEYKLKSAESTVSDMLQAEKFSVGDLDYLQPDADTTIKDGIQVVITKVDARVIKESKDISFDTVYKNDDNLERGVTKIVQNGQIGKKQVSFKVLLENGKEVSRQIVSEVILKNPVQKIVHTGTLGVINLSRGGKVYYTKSFVSKTTAYSSDYACTGKSPWSSGYGVTSSGARAVRNPNGYSSVAVDPRVIPLGTRLYIEGYGYAIAQDTGSSIRGKWIDLFMNSYSNASSWGVRYVNVYILK